MYARVQEYIQRQCDLLRAGRFDEYAKNLRYPFVVNFGNHRLVIRDRVEATGLLQNIHASCISSGLTRSQVHVAAISLSRKGRIRVWADYHDVNTMGAVFRQRRVEHYCSMTQHGLVTEMSSSQEMCTPEVIAQAIDAQQQAFG